MDVKAIIFLAPISVFDERQGEGGVNRLEDSMKFWTTICKSKLLIKVIHPYSPLETGGTEEPSHVL
jgi:guanine nucleotide-binding protein alpha-1 subunit